MASPQNPYQVLGLRPTATTDEIRRAYRRLALDCHPDRHPGDGAATARFRDLTQAYNALMDPARRREIDGLLRSFWRQIVGAKGAASGAPGGRGGGERRAGSTAARATAPEAAPDDQRDLAERRRGGGFFDALFGNVRPAPGTPPHHAAPASASPGATPPPRPGRPSTTRPAVRAPSTTPPPSTPPPAAVVEAAVAPPAPPHSQGPATPHAAAAAGSPAAAAPTSSAAAAPVAAPPLERGETRVVLLDLPFELAAVGGPFEADVALDLTCPDCVGSGSAPGADTPTCPDCHGTGERAVVAAPSAQRPAPAAAAGALPPEPDPAAPTRSVCPRCLGRGHLVVTPCGGCDGTGSIQHQRHYRLMIPPCMPDLHRIRIEGDGEPGRDGGLPGDLLLVLRARRHPHFRRRGRDLHSRIVLNVAQAAFGDTVEVPTLHGPVSLDLPAGTQPGTVFRLAGWGVGGARSLLTADRSQPLLHPAPSPDGFDWDAAAGAAAGALAGAAAPLAHAASASAGEAAAPPGDHYLHVHVEMPRLTTDTERKRFYTMAKTLKLLDAMNFPPPDPKPTKKRGADG